MVPEGSTLGWAFGFAVCEGEGVSVRRCGGPQAVVCPDALVGAHGVVEGGEAGGEGVSWVGARDVAGAVAWGGGGGVCGGGGGVCVV